METDITQFSNQAVVPADLPAIEQLEQQQLSPKYAKINVIICLVLACLSTFAATITLFQPFFKLPATLQHIVQYAIIGFPLFFTLLALFGYASDKIKRFALRENDLSYTSGLIFRKTVTQPILRIQHVELKRGPIERKADLASLQVFSAGGALHTFEIPGLPLEQAESIRQFIISHKDTILHG